MLFGTMKLWLKYAFGIAMGAILYIALPPSMIHGTAVISFLADISQKIGAYALILTLVAGLPISAFRLSEKGSFARPYFRSLLFFIAGLLLASALGIAAAMIARPAPLPLVSESGTIQSLDPLELLRATFPANIFSVFPGATTWFLPIALFALAFGLALAHDPVMSRPILPTLDVLSRAAYLINTFITEILGILLIPVSLYLFLSLRNSGFPPEYRGIILFSVASTIACVAGVFPLAYRIFGGRRNPYAMLYGMLGPLLASAASSSMLFSSGTSLRHISENLGVKRDRNALLFPSALIVGRIGSAFIVAAAFISMLLSYSRNSPSIGQLIGIAVLVPLAVIVGSAGLRSDVLLMLSLSCALFGQGFQNGATLLVPVALPLSMCAAVLDTAWMMFSVSLLAELRGERSSKKARNYI